ncbi:hypothetical protein EV426DRAFT_714033 [Tirmania nivea]|nr:hypothetical protein EV426DRAFT_714033 [Tirmania nivea]
MSTLQGWATAPPGYVHETRVPMITAVCITLPIITFMFVGMRFYVRRYLLGGVGADDWLALMGAACMIGITAVSMWGTTIGYGTHIWEVKESSMQGIGIVLTALLFIAQFGSMFVQLTLLTFYCRISTCRAIHYLCYLIMFLAAAMTIFRAIFSGIMCFRIQPDAALMCKDNKTLNISHAVVGITTNFVILIVPIPMLWRLKSISVLRRLGLVVIFSVGLIAIVSCSGKFAIIKMVMKKRDPTWGMSWIAVICQIEVGAGVICACLPMVRPLFLKNSWFSSAPKGSPPMDEVPKAEWGGNSGNGAVFLKRAKAGWEGKSLTATWQGVQRYYHTRWGRQRSIIEVADLEGLGVLGSLYDYPKKPLEGNGKYGHTRSDSAEMHRSQLVHDMRFGCRGNKTPGENTTLPSPTPVQRCHKTGVSWDESRRLSRFQPSTASEKDESANLALPPRRPKASESGDAVLLSSMALVADGSRSEGGGISITPKTIQTSATCSITAPPGGVRG